jgi:Nitrile hydratase, alpha chain
MTNPKEDNSNGAELLAYDDESNLRREMLKRIGLSAGALAVTALGSSGASAQGEKAQGVKTAPNTSDQSSDAEHRIIERALKDKEYRKRLIANPRKVIGEEIGSALPPRVQFKVLQETADTVYLVLPHMPAVGEEKLSNTDVQNVAIGIAFTRSWFRVCPCRCSSLSVCD